MTDDVCGKKEDDANLKTMTGFGFVDSWRPKSGWRGDCWRRALCE